MIFLYQVFAMPACLMTIIYGHCKIGFAELENWTITVQISDTKIHIWYRNKNVFT